MCHEAGQSTFLHTQLYFYLRILIITYLATFLGTNSLYVLMCHKAVNQSIDQSCIQLVLYKLAWHNVVDTEQHSVILMYWLNSLSSCYIYWLPCYVIGLGEGVVYIVSLHRHVYLKSCLQSVYWICFTYYTPFYSTIQCLLVVGKNTWWCQPVRWPFTGVENGCTGHGVIRRHFWLYRFWLCL